MRPNKTNIRPSLPLQVLRRSSPVLLSGLLVAAGLAGTLAPLGGQEPRSPQAAMTTGDTLELTFAEAIRRGLGEGEEVEAARARHESAEAAVRSTRSQGLPQLSGSLSYERQIASPFQRTDDVISLPGTEDNTWTAAVTLSQPLFTGGRVRGATRRAEATADAADARVGQQESELSFRISQAYLDALLFARRVEIARAAIAQLRDQLAQVRLEREAGNASDRDVLRVEVELANAEPELVDAQNARDLARRDLKQLTNIPAARQIRLAGELDAAAFEPVSREVLDAYLSNGVVARRPDVEEARSQLAAIRAGVDVAQAAYWPDLSVSARLGAQAFPRDFLPEDSEFQLDASVGFSVQLPLFQGLRRPAEVGAAKAEARAARLDIRRLEAAAELEIAQARAELERSATLISARGEAVRQAQRVFELTRLSYEQGEDTFLDLNDARLSLQQARLNEAGAVHDYYVSLARLMRAAGEPPRQAPERARTLFQLSGANPEDSR